MSLPNIFDFQDYRAFLKAQIEAHSQWKGYQSQLAEAAGCQKSFLSQVLKDKMDLSRDHAAELCRFWGLNAESTEYFLNLVDLNRAGSPHLKEFISNRLKELKKNKSILEGKVPAPKILQPEHEARYYSSWYWGAIHILCAIHEFQTVPHVSSRLGLPVDLCQNVLATLEQMGFVKRAGGRWQIANNNLHIPEDSPLNMVNHINWRHRAMVNLQNTDRHALHYTSTMAISNDDAKVIQGIVTNATLKTRELALKSPEEDLFALTIDFFKV